MADQNCNHVTRKIEEMLKEAKPLFTRECCIYRVPRQIRKLNEEAYTPKVVSIGAFHHGDENLLKMEGQKRIYCEKFIERSEKNLDRLVRCVQQLEPKVRRSYSDNINLNEEDHVMVIVVDCGFIIELLLRYHFNCWTDDDAICLSPWLRSDIRWDLLLLENQLPFFILEKIYNLAFFSKLNNGDHDHPPFLSLTLKYFGHSPNFPSNDSIAHFTDLSRTLKLNSCTSLPIRKENSLPRLYSATELHEAGVCFKVSKTSKDLLDLRFEGHTLRIPEIKVDDTTEIWLRNVVAFEQCHYPDQSYITDYIAVLDLLINTEKDVDLLVKSGIIVNWLGDSNAVAELFNGLWKNVAQSTFNENYLRTCQQLNAFRGHPWNRLMATLRRDYFNTPWKMVASIAGIALLLLTIIQTICSVIQVVQGSSN
ncbi:UPF0481 protein At3g47200-like isoform X1 [Arachis ipaensis]|uniref:UPF0481 protein At3g47200-like isoform X1 n=2 Tax=Arachis ipaensis TaxID=130454 RepID=UPI0007AF62F5|nr:UPF0481 protein At3g47200-like isoform X1 [Arachis ipaensis]XP_025668969.1 UPF0481 protein At3g47200 [Arachis hypogaea]